MIFTCDLYHMRITVKAIRKGVPSPTPNPTGRARDSVGACIVGMVELGAGHMSAIDALQSMHVPLCRYHKLSHLHRQTIEDANTCTVLCTSSSYLQKEWWFVDYTQMLGFPVITTSRQYNNYNL